MSSRTLLIFAIAFLPQLSFAQNTPPICKTPAQAIQGLNDDYCEEMSDVTLDCFRAMNTQLQQVLRNTPEHRTNKTPVDRAQVLKFKKAYENEITNMEAYIEELRKLDCGDEETEVEVTIEEMQQDILQLNEALAKEDAK